MLALGLVASACTNGGDGSDSVAEGAPSTPLENDSTSSTTTQPPDSTASDEPEPTDEDVDEVDAEPDLAALEELWGLLWDASGLVPDERGPAIAELGDAIHPIVAEGVPTMLLESTERAVHTYPVFTGDADGTTINIRDCIIYEPQIFESITHIHSGTAIPDGDGGWIIDSVTRETRGCVPAALNEQILTNYDEYRLALAEYWNPPDPDHPLIAETLTGDFHDVTRRAVLQFQVDGRRLDSVALENHPEIVSVFSSTRVLVQDCAVPDPDGGVFKQSGERVEGDVPPKPGSTDLWKVTMTLVDGRWKTENVDATFDADCQGAPTPAGLPKV